MGDRNDSKIKIIRKKLDKGYLCVVSLQAEIRKINDTLSVISYKLIASSFFEFIFLKSFYLCVQIFLTCPKTGQCALCTIVFSKSSAYVIMLVRHFLSTNTRLWRFFLLRALAIAVRRFTLWRQNDWRGDSRTFSMM